jgi:putative transcriptional regulator
MTREELKSARRAPRAKIIRRALGLTPEEFARTYRIPLATLSDWERGASEPDAPASAFLEVIAREPE